jgi:hypothetical protein
MRILISVVAVCTSVALAGPVSTSEHASGRGPAADSQTTSQGDYAWAPSCKKYHEEIYEAWAGTKHARALSRLSSADQQRECVGCHVTGAKTKLEIDGKTVNAGVQCESCHGAAAAHVADPTVKTGLVKTPPAESCTVCHNDRSPSFRGFFYSAMLPLSHRVKK